MSKYNLHWIFTNMGCIRGIQRRTLCQPELFSFGVDKLVLLSLLWVMLVLTEKTNTVHYKDMRLVVHKRPFSFYCDDKAKSAANCRNKSTCSIYPIIVKQDEIGSVWDSIATLGPQGKPKLIAEVSKRITFSRTGRRNITLHVESFTCQDAGVYGCTFGSNRDAGGIYFMKNTIMIVKRQIVAEKQTIDVKDKPIQIYFNQGFTAEITSVAVVTPYTVEWTWERKCSGGWRFEMWSMDHILSNSTELQYQEVDGASCQVMVVNSTLSFMMTPEMEGCMCRCSLQDKLSQKLLTRYSVKIKMKQIKGEGAFKKQSPLPWQILVAIGLFITLVQSVIAFVCYRKRGACNKNHRPVGRRRRHSQFESTNELMTFSQLMGPRHTKTLSNSFEGKPKRSTNSATITEAGTRASKEDRIFGASTEIQVI
ncbi:uncharacterized protein LOC101853734 [Aplysia californica]|uniref:Uncharacterized protein LOC101853734 n=1 Tax=Aplysia californica TaxID=6500 RepID=A0ABM0K5P3_APLCA|nr:uncharacterized protein LOC101853734 [Aplysia californica]XP_005109329.1 uncharacterized protein LOC101853734 [Aplysia californica]